MIKERNTLTQWLDENKNVFDMLDIPDDLLTDDFNLFVALKIRYGSKKMLSIYDRLSGIEVMFYLNNIYSEKWKWLVKFTKETYEVGETNRKKITEKYNSILSGEQTGNVTNKESAYNTDEFINSDMQDNLLNNSGEHEGSRERDEVYKSYYTSLQQLKNIDKHNILEVILQDIQKELCLQVY